MAIFSPLWVDNRTGYDLVFKDLDVPSFLTDLPFLSECAHAARRVQHCCSGLLRANASLARTVHSVPALSKARRSQCYFPHEPDRPLFPFIGCMHLLH